MSKTCGSGHQPGCQIPVSRTDTTTSPPCRSHRARCARRVCCMYLALFREQVANTWASRVRWRRWKMAPWGSETSQLVPGCLDGGSGRLHGAAHHVARSTRERRSSILLRLMRGDVEQMCDEPPPCARAASPSSPWPGQRRSRRRPRAVHLEPVADRRQGFRSSWASIAMTRPSPVGLPQRAVQASILGGGQAARRGEVFRQRQVGGAITAAPTPTGRRSWCRASCRASPAARRRTTAGRIPAGCAGGPRPGPRPPAWRQ